MNFPNTAAEALEIAANLSGNPANKREARMLKEYALWLGRGYPVGYAQTKAFAADAARTAARDAWMAAGTLDGSHGGSWNKSAARRASRARKAAREAARE